MIKTTIDRDQFASKLRMAVAFSDSKPVIEIWKEFKITFQKDFCSITASDGESEVTVRCECKSTESWSVCMPARLFLQVIESYKQDTLTLVNKSSVEKRKCGMEIRAGRSRSVLSSAMMPDEYRTMEHPEMANVMVVPQHPFKDALNTTRMFCDPESANQWNQVISIQEKNNKMVVYSGTTIMISRVEMNPISIESWKSNICIGDKTAKKLAAVLAEKGEVTVSHDDKKTMFTFNLSDDPMDSVTVVCVNSNVKYPEIDKAVFTRIPDTCMQMNVVELKDVAKRLSLFSEDGVPAIIALSNKDMLNMNELAAACVNINMDYLGEEGVPVHNEGQLVFHKKFNIDFLVKILAQISKDEVRVYFQDERLEDKNKVPLPTMFIPVGDESYKFVLLEVR